MSFADGTQMASVLLMIATVSTRGMCVAAISRYIMAVATTTAVAIRAP